MAKKKGRKQPVGRAPRRGPAKSGTSRIVGGIAVVAVLGIAIAVAGWWFLVREDAQLATSPLAISSEDAGSVPAANAEGDVVFTIVQSHPAVSGSTTAAYFSGEKLARLSVPSTATGSTSDVSGQIVLNDSGLSTDAESKITIGLTSLRSNERIRDGRVQDALQTNLFPEATFVATGLTGYPEVFPENEEVAMRLTGMLSIHGVESEVTWEVIATRSGDVLTVLATLETRYRDWNVPVLNIGGFVSVEEDFTLQIRFIAVASEG